MLRIVINYILPIVALTILSKEEYLGVIYAVIVALSLPLLYAVYTLLSKQDGFIHSALGSLMVAINGVLLLLGGTKSLFIAKEVGIPALLATALLVLIILRHPLADFFWNKIFKADALLQGFTERGKIKHYHRYRVSAQLVFLVSLACSALLNLILGVMLISGAPESPELVHSVGVFQGVSTPIIIATNFAILLGGYFFLALKMARSLTWRFAEVFNSQ